MDYVLQVILIFISQVDHVHVEGSTESATVQRISFQYVEIEDVGLLQNIIKNVFIYQAIQ